MPSVMKRAWTDACAAIALHGAMIAAGGGATAVLTAGPAHACGTEPYIGEVCTFATDFCPRGYATADGSLLNINTNTALFAVLGVRYGGNGIQTFGLPDLRGRSVVNVGQGPGLSPVTLGVPFGQSQVTLLQQQMPVHTHAAVFTGTGGGTQTVQIEAETSTLAVNSKLVAKQATGAAMVTDGAFLGQGGTGGAAAPIYVAPSLAAVEATLAGLTVTLTGAPGRPAFNFSFPSGLTGGSVAVQPAGGSQPFSTQSPALGLTQCIAVNGIFPTRP